MDHSTPQQPAPPADRPSTENQLRVDYGLEPIRTGASNRRVSGTTQRRGSHGSHRFSFSSRRGSKGTHQPWSRESLMVFADVNGADLRRHTSIPTWDNDEDAIEDDEDMDIEPVASAGNQHSTEAPQDGGEKEVQRVKSRADIPFHVFSHAKKQRLVYIISLAGLFSPLSSNIYFPALSQISKDIGVSMSLVSLTVTVYMIVQGLAPSFWGPLSDTQGRRIVFIGTFIVYEVANIALAFSDDFTSLMILRAVQAGGSAATISIGAGVIGDMTTAAERGGFVGIFGGIRMLGQSIGPVFGGILSEYLGYASIFWFLFILGAITLVLIVAFLPETLRSIAGNGSVPLHGIHRPLFYRAPKEVDEEAVRQRPPRVRWTVGAVFSPMKFLFEKDVFATLFFGSIVYTVWSMVTSSTSDIFSQLYGLNDLELGLVFLPNGAGCVLGSYLTGRLMDHDFQVVERAYRIARDIPDSVALPKKDLAATDFPIERARQKSIWWIVGLFVASVLSYGFSLRSPNMAAPLIIQFLIAYTATAVFSLNSALVIDLYPGASASATAVNNLVRCLMGAGGVAIIQPIINAIGNEAAFGLLAGVTVVFAPLLICVNLWGSGWRLQRVERLRKKKEEQEAAAAAAREPKIITATSSSSSSTNESFESDEKHAEVTLGFSPPTPSDEESVGDKGGSRV